MKIHTFISSYLESNNYLIEIAPNKYIGIDVGVGVVPKIYEILEKPRTSLLGYFLTHAHADHSAGIQEVFDRYRVPVYCSQECKNDLNNSKRNLSIYTDDIDTYSFNINCEILNDGSVISLNGTHVKSYYVPGHSAGCMAYRIGNMLFTGDFLMRDYTTPIHLPGSNQEMYKKSVKRIGEILEGVEIILAGHGKPFFVHSMERYTCGNKLS